MYQVYYFHRLLVVLIGISAGAVNAAPTIVLNKALSYPEAAWNTEYKDYLVQKAQWLHEDWRQSIKVPAPPNLQVTAKEIEMMVSLSSLRASRQADIDREIELEGQYEKFYRALGAGSETHPHMTELMDKVFDDATIVVFYFKDYFNRARPYHYYPEINNTIDPPGHPAYPSGHSTQAHSMALALAEAFPEHRKDLLEVAYKIATNREIGGVHYKSDTDAGLIVAIQLIGQMRAHPEFQDLIQAVSQESNQ